MYDPLPTYLIFLFMLSSLTHSKVCCKRSDLFSGKHKYVLIFHTISRYWIVYRCFRRNIIVCLVFISCIDLETSHLVMIHSNSVKKTVISPFHIIDTMATNILEPSYQQTWFGLTFSGIYPSLNVMSWNHLFRITVPLWRESTDHQWIPHVKDQQYGPLIFSLRLASTNYWTNSRVIGDNITLTYL